MDISKSVVKLCESGRAFAAKVIDALDAVGDYIDLVLKTAEITAISILVKACSKAVLALADRARYVAECIEEDERSRYGNCRR